MIPENERFDNHEFYSELCALALSGTLSVAERAELTDHFKTCQECRKTYSEYMVLVREGIPMLADGYEHEGEPREDLIRRYDLTSRRASRVSDVVKSFHLTSFQPFRQVALYAGSFAVAAACLALGVRLGEHRNALQKQPLQLQGAASADRSFQRLLDEKNQASQLLSVESGRLDYLQRESSQRESEIGNLKTELQTWQDHANELARSKLSSDEQLHAVFQERDSVATRLEETQALYEKSQGELETLRSEKESTLSHMASLEEQVGILLGVNREDERRIKEQEQFLASDRDIRELMGARNLYIADVFDVDSGSRTQKAFGRVFYTQGKSLIFYAFDLDSQPGMKQGSIFQAWGQRETEQAKPLNLGVLYRDNVSNRRWALRFDDPAQLAQINAVFVTVEPNGGSREPTAKPFLYALLRAKPNHP
jgi:hypothetical protein